MAEFLILFLPSHPKAQTERKRRVPASYNAIFNSPFHFGTSKCDGMQCVKCLTCNETNTAKVHSAAKPWNSLPVVMKAVRIEAPINGKVKKAVVRSHLYANVVKRTVVTFIVYLLKRFQLMSLLQNFLP